MIWDAALDDCPNCGNEELVREERPYGSTGVTLPYTRWTCIRCRFTWYTPLTNAPAPASLDRRIATGPVTV